MNKLIEKIAWITFAIALLVFPFQIMEPAPFDILIGLIIIPFCLLIYFSKEKRGLSKKSINIVDVFLILFLFSNLITLIISKSIFEIPSLNFFFKTFYLIILYFVVKLLIVCDFKRADKIIKFLLIGILIVVGFVWLNYILFNLGPLKLTKLIILILRD
jgi:hypothetical protein